MNLRAGNPRLLLYAAIVAASVFPLCAQNARDLSLKQRNETRAPAHIPTGYAIVIGVGRYQNLGPENDLRFAESDAEAVYRVLIGKEAGAFPPENVRRLIGKDATRANIEKAIETWLPSVARPEDRVVVYFAGHGLVHDRGGYLAPWDIDLRDIARSAYPMRSLGDTLAKRVKARWKALFTDSCHSGRINSETSDETVWTELNASTDGVQFLSFVATLGREKSYEDEHLATGFGLFSYFLVEGLKGGADNDPCDGWVRAGELVEYVRTHVRKHAKELGVPQTPHAGSDYDPAMIFAKAAGCGAAPPDEATAGAAVVEVNLEGVDVFVDDRYIGKASQGAPLRIPGLRAGPHTIRAVKEGYEPDIRQIVVTPSRETGVRMRIRYPRNVNPRARELVLQGEKLLYTRRSAVNPVNILPAPRKQSARDLRKAAAYFERALSEDPQYIHAAYHLGVARQLLDDERGSMAAYQRAISLDPTNVAARLQYAGVVIENGDADEGIRQIAEALRFEPSNGEAEALLARAYWDKGVWVKCAEHADRALAASSDNSLAHLWRADCLRQIADAGNDTAGFAAAAESYRQFLTLTNYGTSVLDWLTYHFFGFGWRGRSHADRQVSYDQLRQAGYLGLCICERKSARPLRAREYCKRAIAHDTRDAIAYFVLGLANLDVFARTETCGDLLSARASFKKMLEINPKLTEARSARHYLEEIDVRMAKLRRVGC